MHGDSERYEGQWHEGLKHGQGTRIYSSGAQYEGSWKEDKREGYGQQTYVDGTIYDGGWHDDKEHGWGKKVKPNGEVYSGGFRDGNEYGYAVREHADGRKFEGGISAGQASGFGVGTTKDGRRIEGGWKEGKVHGLATEEFGTLKHVGNFAAGFWDGPGEQTYGKNVTAGEWRKGKLIESKTERSQTVKKQEIKHRKPIRDPSEAHQNRMGEEEMKSAAKKPDKPFIMDSSAFSQACRYSDPVVNAIFAIEFAKSAAQAILSRKETLNKIVVQLPGECHFDAGYDVIPEGYHPAFSEQLDIFQGTHPIRFLTVCRNEGNAMAHFRSSQRFREQRHHGTRSKTVFRCDA